MFSGVDSVFDLTMEQAMALWQDPNKSDLENAQLTLYFGKQALGMITGTARVGATSSVVRVASAADTGAAASTSANLTTYYQVTSMDNAQTIINTGKLTGSRQEVGQVFAFTEQPTYSQASLSGARSLQTVIQFQAAAGSFSRTDTTINPSLQSIARVGDGPINVTKVQIVGFKAVWYNPLTWFN